jgi:hypothetical protein
MRDWFETLFTTIGIVWFIALVINSGISAAFGMQFWLQGKYAQAGMLCAPVVLMLVWFGLLIAYNIKLRRKLRR